MDFEQPQIETEQERFKFFLDFTEEEKTEVIAGLVRDFGDQGAEVGESEVEFPSKKDEIASFIYSFPQHFRSERLTEAAIQNSEYAKLLTRELTERKDFDQVLKILRQYKDKPMFRHCVSEIENVLVDDSSRDSILIKLSESIAQTGEEERVADKKFSEYMFRKPERAARRLSTYLKFLQIDEKQARELLNHKSLLLIGGGIAPIKKELSGKGIDCEVTNIEPLLTEEHQGNSDHPIPENFYDVAPETLEKYDEVWSANNSLPTYAFNPEQVKTFYQRALGTILQGGYLRIFPVSGFADAITPSMRLNRIPTNNASIQCVNLLKQHPELFEVEEFETPAPKQLIPSYEKKFIKGVNIKVVGDDEKMKAFLENFIDKK